MTKTKVVRPAVQVGVSDVWQGKSNAERKAWLQSAGCSTHWDTTTFEALPKEVQAALSE